MSDENLYNVIRTIDREALAAEASSEDKRVPQVIQEMRNLEEACENLKELSLLLIDHLKPVLREKSTLTKEENQAPLPQLCPVAERLREATFQITTIDRYLSGTLENLEV